VARAPPVPRRGTRIWGLTHVVGPMGYRVRSALSHARAPPPPPRGTRSAVRPQWGQASNSAPTETEVSSTAAISPHTPTPPRPLLALAPSLARRAVAHPHARSPPPHARTPTHTRTLARSSARTLTRPHTRPHSHTRWLTYTQTCCHNRRPLSSCSRRPVGWLGRPIGTKLPKHVAPLQYYSAGLCPSPTCRYAPSV
jgi:hypothetical protein